MVFPIVLAVTLTGCIWGFVTEDPPATAFVLMSGGLIVSAVLDLTGVQWRPSFRRSTRER